MNHSQPYHAVETCKRWSCCKYQIIVVLFLSRITCTISFPFSNNGNFRKPPPPLPTSTDPHVILNIRAWGITKKDIKRAYHEAALLYHPDVRIVATSTREERDKANEEFSRINAAYQDLMGKDPTPKPPSPRTNSNTRAKQAEVHVKEDQFGSNRDYTHEQQGGGQVGSQQGGRQGGRQGGSSASSSWTSSHANKARVHVNKSQAHVHVKKNVHVNVKVNKKSNTNTSGAGRQYQSYQSPVGHIKNNVVKPKIHKPNENAKNFSDFFDSDAFHARYTSSNGGVGAAQATYTASSRFGESRSSAKGRAGTANTRAGPNANTATATASATYQKQHTTKASANKTYVKKFGDFYDADSFQTRIHANMDGSLKNENMDSSRGATSAASAASQFTQTRGAQRSQGPRVSVSAHPNDSMASFSGAKFGDFFDADNFHAKYNPMSTGVLQGEEYKKNIDSSVAVVSPSSSTPVSKVGTNGNPPYTSRTTTNPSAVKPPATSSSTSTEGRRDTQRNPTELQSSSSPPMEAKSHMSSPPVSNFAPQDPAPKPPMKADNPSSSPAATNLNPQQPGINIPKPTMANNPSSSPATTNLSPQRNGVVGQKPPIATDSSSPSPDTSGSTPEQPAPKKRSFFSEIFRRNTHSSVSPPKSTTSPSGTKPISDSTESYASTSNSVPTSSNRISSNKTSDHVVHRQPPEPKPKPINIKTKNVQVGRGSIDRIDTYDDQYLASQQVKGWNDGDTIENVSAGHHHASSQGSSSSSAHSADEIKSGIHGRKNDHHEMYTISNYNVANSINNVKTKISTHVPMGGVQHPAQNKEVVDGSNPTDGGSGQKQRAQSTQRVSVAKQEPKKYGDFFDADSFHSKWNAADKKP